MNVAELKTLVYQANTFGRQSHVVRVLRSLAVARELKTNSRLPISDGLNTALKFALMLDERNKNLDQRFNIAVKARLGSAPRVTSLQEMINHVQNTYLHLVGSAYVPSIVRTLNGIIYYSSMSEQILPSYLSFWGGTAFHGEQYISNAQAYAALQRLVKDLIGAWNRAANANQLSRFLTKFGISGYCIEGATTDALYFAGHLPCIDDSTPAIQTFLDTIEEMIVNSIEYLKYVDRKKFLFSEVIRLILPLVDGKVCSRSEGLPYESIDRENLGICLNMLENTDKDEDQNSFDQMLADLTDFIETNLNGALQTKALDCLFRISQLAQIHPEEIKLLTEILKHEDQMLRNPLGFNQVGQSHLAAFKSMADRAQGHPRPKMRALGIELTGLGFLVAGIAICAASILTGGIVPYLLLALGLGTTAVVAGITFFHKSRRQDLSHDMVEITRLISCDPTPMKKPPVF